MSAPQKSRWGSFLSQAVAGVEARLDNILAEDDSTGNRPTTGSRSASSSSPVPPAAASVSNPPARSTTPSKSANDRLQERLARAVAAKNSSQKSNSFTTEPRASIDLTSASPSQSSRPSLDGPSIEPSAQPLTAATRTSVSVDNPPAASLPTPERTERLPTTPSNESKSATNTPRSSIQSERPPRVEESSLRSAITVEPPTQGTAADVERALSALDLQDKRVGALEKTLQETQAQHQEELHSYVERVDALQAKLQYLAREASEAARHAASVAPAGSLEKKIAEKDQQVAQLMEEGQRLANNEQKHRSIIKKLRAQLAASENDLNEQKIWRQKAEVELSYLRARSRELEDFEKANEGSRRLTDQLQRDMEKLRVDLASRDNAISELKRQLQEEADRAKSTAVRANDQLLEARQNHIKELEDAVTTLKVEKGLVADRAKAHAVELQEKAERAIERSRAVELDLKGEIQALESKLEAFRVRAEEVSSGAIGDAQAKLLRQIETLQTQYAVASENWQGIEASLVARVANLERERDAALRRESEMRKKARETAARAKHQEEELEAARNQLPSVQKDLSSYQSQLECFRKRAEEAETALAEARCEFDKQRMAWKEKAERMDSERRQWPEDLPNTSLRSNSRPQSPLLSAAQRTFSGEFLGLQSFPSKFRKPSAPSSIGEPSPGDHASSARRPSAQPPTRSPMIPTFPRQSGTSQSHLGGLEMLASPSTYPLDRDDPFDSADTPASPQNVLQDMVSVSTIGAGPSVQLVERMSAAIRRLESEKVAAKEELARISSQRDEARAEIVTLMREVGAGKAAVSKVESLEKEIAEIHDRYQTTLEMLGEKSELVEELRADVDDVKAMYRDLVERTIK
ncbi:hypothetical protein DL766_002897 [Monosporascus sp. MC13-8B]|uniref:TATA element modulatory factor 1 TATA binding domain-containing protein n=1 Tax=Monosporascus cannonballus TaxID=155416 RepID=A0ABY0GYQ7_9PEZI|nr:hypothetical protein DL762_007578 [Monosporascus cannonballus]RYP34589.1 hypothetical protein DL766_002897 [Monosporascus sp. MC13-8B]